MRSFALSIVSAAIAVFGTALAAADEGASQTREEIVTLQQRLMA